MKTRTLLILSALFLVGCSDRVEINHLHGTVVHIEQDESGCTCEVEFESTTNVTTGGGEGEDNKTERLFLPCGTDVEVGDQLRMFYKSGEE